MLARELHPCILHLPFGALKGDFSRPSELTVALRDREDEAGPDAARCGGRDWVEGGPVAAPWVAASGAVVAQGVHAVARAFFGHAVREREDCTVEVGGGGGRLQAAFAAAGAATAGVAAVVAVAFEVGFFEVER